MKNVRATLFVAMAVAAGAQAGAQTASLRLDSQPGDYVGGGALWQYDEGDAAFQTGSDGSMITVTVWPQSGGWWTVQLAAPPGDQLAVGAYENAVRASFRPAGSPGIDVTGMGVGCNETAGRFDVSDVVFGPNNYVISFSATFEQWCDNATGALLGEIHIQNPPPPPAQVLGWSADEAVLSKVTGAASLRGTLACAKPASVNLGVTLTQRISRTEVVQGFAFTSAFCTAPGVPLELTVHAGNGRSFVKGRPVEVSANASAYDPDYGTWVNASSVQVVRLK